MGYRDRFEAGRQLAATLAGETLHDPVVLALPRGAVPVGFEVARILGAPLDVYVVRKVGAPQHPEYGIGAIAEDGELVIDRWATERLRISAEALDSLVALERLEVERRVRHYRGDRPLTDVAGRDVVIVDDGLATGVTAEAAVRALRKFGPRRLIVAAPVCAPDSAARLRRIADDVVCVHEPRHFRAVGQYYDDFEQTTDREVHDLLERSMARDRDAGAPDA